MWPFFKRRVSPPERDTDKAIAANYKDILTSFSSLQMASAEVTAVASDTARLLEQQLQKSESRFYSTIDSIDDVVIIKDGEGRWKTLNRFGQEIFQLKHEDYCNKTGAEIAEMFPWLADTLDQCVVTDDRAWSRGESSRSEEKVPVGDDFIYLDVIKTPTYTSTGGRHELICVGRDVTAVREKQRRTKAFFTALNSASDYIAIVDGAGLISFCNDEFVKKFGHTDYSDLIGRPVCDIGSIIPNFEEGWKIVQQNKVWSYIHPATGTQAVILPVMNGKPTPIYYIFTIKHEPKSEDK